MEVERAGQPKYLTKVYMEIYFGRLGATQSVLSPVFDFIQANDPRD